MVSLLLIGYSEMTETCIFNLFTIGITQNCMYNGKSKLIWHRYNTFQNLFLIGVIFIDNVKFKDDIMALLIKGLYIEFFKNYQRK